MAKTWNLSGTANYPGQRVRFWCKKIQNSENFIRDSGGSGRVRSGAATVICPLFPYSWQFALNSPNAVSAKPLHPRLGFCRRIFFIQENCINSVFSSSNTSSISQPNATTHTPIPTARAISTRTRIKDPEEVTNKMYGCNIDIEVALSGSLICARVPAGENYFPFFSISTSLRNDDPFCNFFPNHNRP